MDDMEDKDETHYGLNGSPTQVKRIFPPTANDHHEVWDGDGSEVADKLFHMIDHRYEIYLKGGNENAKISNTSGKSRRSTGSG